MSPKGKGGPPGKTLGRQKLSSACRGGQREDKKVKSPKKERESWGTKKIKLVGNH